MKQKTLAIRLYTDGIPFIAYEFDNGEHGGCGVLRLDRVVVATGQLGQGIRRRMTPCKVRKFFRLIARTSIAPEWWMYAPGMDELTKRAYEAAILDVCPEARLGELSDLLT